MRQTGRCLTSKAPGTGKPGREYYTVFGGQHDSYLQTDLAQFFAPETLGQVKEKILNRDIGASAQIALGKHIDFIPAFAEFYYTSCQENCSETSR